MKKKSTQSITSFGSILEKIEILRSSLRWATRLDRNGINRLLRQCTGLRNEVRILSRRERTREDGLKPGPKPRSNRQRKQALLDRNFAYEGVFGESPKLLETMEIVEKAAAADIPVLIDGESGTGKELLARVVHANSNRADGAFVSVNCGAIPENLIESELFGHTKGAFTGATSSRDGRFETANGGTIFLDEIGELPLSGQVKLLRVLQSNEIQRVGSDTIQKVNVRIVAATNRDLRQMAAIGTFREDLYYRLGIIHVTLPPLRERLDEIPLLQDYFCDEAAEQLKRNPIRLSAELKNFLISYHYPGNIRELRNIIYRLTCLSGSMATPEQLPDYVRGAINTETISIARESSNEAEPADLKSIRKKAADLAEKEFLRNGLQDVEGRVTQLAKQNNMNRTYLQTLLKKHDLHSKDFRTRTNGNN